MQIWVMNFHWLTRRHLLTHKHTLSRWQGENCTECSTLPGCQYGSCTEPLDCNCQTGWQGTFCSTRKLTLRFIWKLTNTCQHLQRSVRRDVKMVGVRDQTNVDVKLDSEVCVVEHFFFFSFKQTVSFFSGENCTDCVAYPGCEHGKCSNNKPWTC